MLEGDAPAYSLRYSEKGSRVEAVIEPRSTIRLRNLELVSPPEERQVKISLELHDLPAELPESFFTFPADDLEKTGITIENAVSSGPKAMQLAAAVSLASLARAAIENPRLRGHELFELFSEERVDWDVVQKRDAEITGALCEMFQTQLRILKIQQVGAGQPATAPESKSDGEEKPKPESEGRSQ